MNVDLHRFLKAGYRLNFIAAMASPVAAGSYGGAAVGLLQTVPERQWDGADCGGGVLL